MSFLNSFFKADGNVPGIDWSFTDNVVDSANNPTPPQDEDFEFSFRAEDFEDAVVMPSYRNIDQPQYFYVAEIRSDLNPASPFPSPELYKTFAEYYASKYGLAISNLEQPLLDVDHTSARLNLLIPRYMNQKGVPLPTSSAETKRARRENLQQKQILVPELCDMHVFPASLWRKAVCLPAILYRLNYLLLSEDIRKHVAIEANIGIVDLPKGHRFPKLDFGVDTSPENLRLMMETAKESLSPSDDNISAFEDSDDGDSEGGNKKSKESTEGHLPKELEEINIENEVNGVATKNEQCKDAVKTCNWSENEKNELKSEDNPEDRIESESKLPKDIVTSNGFIESNGTDMKDKIKETPAVPTDTHVDFENGVSDISEQEDDLEDIDSGTDIFANVERFVSDEERARLLNEEKYPEPLASLDVDMDVSTFVGPSPCEVLQALTMSNANDFFSLERLETIGDSFLKYAVTVYLYCSYPGIHEGKLSYLRSKQVSNYNLYRLGKRKGLAECMISTKFEPYENWLPPGYVINEDKRKGPVPRVHVAPESNQFRFTSGTKGQESKHMNGHEVKAQKKQACTKVIEIDNDTFLSELEEADQISRDKDEEFEQGERLRSNHHFVPYNLQIHHCLPDKSIADCVEALIGCYLTSCDKIAALRFMSWMGLKVLPTSKGEVQYSAMVRTFKQG